MCKTSENINIPEGQMCENGCGDPAICKLKCGKYCCSKVIYTCDRKKKFNKVFEKCLKNEWKCLTTFEDYKNDKNKLPLFTIQCKCGNIRDMPYENFKTIKGCKHCSQRGYTIEDLNKKA